MTSFARAPLNVAADDTLAVDGVVVLDDRQRLWCAIAVKATYRLAPDECTLETRSLPVYFEDQLRDPAAGKGIMHPCDLDPMKSAPEVVVSGSAFASVAPVDHVVARIVAGEIDKSVEAWVQRRYRVDGSVEAKGTANRFPLDFTVAAGGPGSDNPTGMNLERVDSRGRRRVPQLLPPGFTLGGPGAFVPLCGLGALGTDSPTRQRRLRDEDRAWLANPAALPVPDSFDTRYFQSTLPDQWAERPWSASEWLVLEQLHPRHAQLVTRLPGIEPRGYAYGQPLSLRAELLVIDTDLGVVTLTWRGRCDLDPSRPSVPLVIQMAQGAPATPSPHAVAPPAIPLARPMTAFDEPTDALRDIALDTTGMELPGGGVDALPFLAPSAHGRAARGSHVDGVLPFRDTPLALAQSAAVSVPVPPSAPPPPAPLPPPPATVTSTERSGGANGLGLAALGSAGNGSTLSSRGPSALPSAPPTPSPSVFPPSNPGIGVAFGKPLGSSPPPGPVPAPPVSATSLPMLQPPPPPSSARPERVVPSESKSDGFGAAFGSVRPATLPVVGRDDVGAARKASDAAAEREREREGAQRSAAAQPADPSALRRRASVDLLGFDAAILRRIRNRAPFAAWLKAIPARRAAGSLDAPRVDDEDKDRNDVLRVFSYGRPLDLGEARRALEAAFDDDQLDPPLLLLSGEARPVFDEIEVLRTTMTIAQPLAPTEKRMTIAVNMATEALGANPLPSGEKASSLARQIEQATSGLSLPPRFVASQVERSLLEGRKFKRRELWGAQRFRVDLVVGSESVPCYIDDGLATHWPLLPTVNIVLLGEIRPREDAGETAPEAFLARAVGRVLATRPS